MAGRSEGPRWFLLVARVFSLVLVVHTAGLLVAVLRSEVTTFRLIQIVFFVAMTVFWFWYGWWGLARRRSDPGAT